MLGWAGLGWAGPREAGLALVGAGGGHTALALQPHTHRGLHAVVCCVMCSVWCEMCVVVCATLHRVCGVEAAPSTRRGWVLGAGRAAASPGPVTVWGQTLGRPHCETKVNTKVRNHGEGPY